MRVVEEKYSVEGVPTGVVIRGDKGRTTEYLGSDGYWTRDSYSASPFATQGLAEAKVQELNEA